MDEFLGFMVIVGLFIFGIIYMSIWASKQKKIIDNMLPAADAGAIQEQHEKELSRLKERVATLEKIVTNQTFDLKHEIEKLDAA